MKLSPVSTTYGAPMGRRSENLFTHCPHSVRLSRVRLDAGGYDNGGAYWGHAKPLWVATDIDGSQAFVRTRTRYQAALILGIGALALKKADIHQFVDYGMALLDGRAPMPDGVTRADVVQWLQESGVHMGQETRKIGRRHYPDYFITRQEAME